jgi:uncharacterized protein (UPF0332 family)
LLALKKYDSKKHSGVISYFAQYFIKTGIIEPEYSKRYLGDRRKLLKITISKFPFI